MHVTMRKANKDIIAHWRQTLPAIPAGAIFLTALSSAPTNWAIKNYTASRMIKAYGTGAHLAGDSGGTLDTELSGSKRSLTISQAGAHYGGNTRAAYQSGGMGGFQDPDHGHGDTQQEASVPYYARLQCRFMKATADLDELPDNCFWLAFDAETKSSPWSRSRNSVENVDSLIMIGGAAQSTSWYARQSSLNVTPANSGTHDHGGHAGVASGSATTGPTGPVAGNHMHGVTAINYTFDVSMDLFNIWVNYSGSPLSMREGNLGVHAFWDQATPPLGWEIFVPTLGAFVGSAYNQASGGTHNGGGNLISGTGTTPYGGDHNHFTANVTTTDESDRLHVDTVGGHTHTFSYSGQIYKPDRVYTHLIRRIW